MDGKKRENIFLRAAVCFFLMACVLVLGQTGEALAATSSDGQYTYETDTDGQAILTGYLGQQTEVAVPATMDGISVKALRGTYQNNDKITKVTIPAGISIINDTAFAGCKSVNRFVVDEASAFFCTDEVGALYSRDRSVLVRYPVGRHENSGNFAIPSTVVTVAGYAFEGYNTQTVEIPASVRTIGDYAFANTGNFNGVKKWEEGTQVIGTYAFYKCTNLNLTGEAALPSTVITAGVYAFAECSNIQIDISKTSLTEIADYLFYNCDNLHNLTLPQTVAVVGAYAFSECNNLNEVVFGANVTSIKEGAFKNCSNLHTAKIPEGVTAIENYTFQGCQNLNTVVLPSTLTKIGDGAFSGCQNLHSINIPEGVQYISNSSFEGVDTSKIALNVKIPKTKLKSAKRKGKKKVKLTWKKKAGVTGYAVYRSKKKGKGYKLVKTVKGENKTGCVVPKLKKGKKCYYKVKVFKTMLGKKYYSSFSNVKAA